LFLEVLIKEQMDAVEVRSRSLPVMLLVQVPERHGIGKKLIQVIDAGGRDRYVQGQRVPAGGTESLRYSPRGGDDRLLQF
jgi:hypothetical protein